MQNLGNKIMIVGVSASGKSTFTRKLAELVHLPTIFIDTILWKPDWTYIGDAAASQELDQISQANQWIIEGFVIPETKALLFSRADTIIFLRYSRILILYRYIKRWFQHRKNPRPELNGNTERLRLKMIKRIWQQQETQSLDALLDQPAFKQKVIQLNSPHETNLFLEKLK